MDFTEWTRSSPTVVSFVHVDEKNQVQSSLADFAEPLTCNQDKYRSFVLDYVAQFQRIALGMAASSNATPDHASSSQQSSSLAILSLDLEYMC